MIDLDFILELGLHVFILIFLLYIYQEMHLLSIQIYKICFLSLVGSVLTGGTYIYFVNNCWYLVLSTFLLFVIILYLLNLNQMISIIYYSSFVSALIFYIYILIFQFSRGKVNHVISLYYPYYVTSILLSLIIMCIIVFLIKIKFYLPDTKIKYFIIVTSISTLFIEVLYMYYFYTKNIYRIIFLIIIGLIIFGNNIIIQYLYNDFHQLTVMSQNNFLSKITNSYIQGIHNEQEKVFKIRHDIKNNLIILQHLINNNQIAEANQVIDEINNHLKYKKSDVYTGNIFIDAYLSNIINNSQIEVQIKCNDLKDLHYKPDVISIIINLVDNAVENANHLVNIQIIRKNPNNILIKVSNDCEHDSSKHLKKSKKQGDHGYGLRIVKDVVNQYQGTYLTSYQNGMFTTYVMLNLEENDEK